MRSLTIAAVLAAGSSCAIGAKSSADALPPKPAHVDVIMKEYSFEFDPNIPAGRVVFDVTNEGSVEHAMTFVNLPEDFPPINEQIRSEERRGVPTIARIGTIAPGARSTFAVDLEPGRYAMVCFVRDADGSTHAAKGQTAEFRVL